MVIFQYPKCSTCKKAIKFLNEKKIPYEERHMVEEVPTKEELSKLIKQSGLPIQKFFNTSGQKYRELQLASKLKDMTEDEKIEMLSSDGMLIKRPIITDGHRVVVGFKEEQLAAWLDD